MPKAAMHSHDLHVNGTSYLPLGELKSPHMTLEDIVMKNSSDE